MLAEIQRFGSEVKSQMGTHVLCEDVAFKGLAIAILNGANFVAVSDPGAAKSELVLNSWRLIEEAYEPGGHLNLVGKADTTPGQLVGGRMTTKHSEKGKGRDIEYETVTSIESVVNPSNVAIAFDEINLGDPGTTQSLNSVVENRRLSVDGHDIALPRLQYFGAIMNRRTRGDGFDMPERMASRLTMGLHMGDNPNAAMFDRVQRVVGISNPSRVSDPSTIKPVTNLEHLAAMRSYVRRVQPVEKMLEYSSLSAVVMSDAMRAERNLQREDPGRIGMQIIRGAQAIACLENEEGTITKQAIDMATRYTLLARLLVRSTKEYDEVEAFVAETMGKIEFEARQFRV